MRWFHTHPVLEAYTMPKPGRELEYIDGQVFIWTPMREARSASIIYCDGKVRRILSQEWSGSKGWHRCELRLSDDEKVAIEKEVGGYTEVLIPYTSVTSPPVEYPKRLY